VIDDSDAAADGHELDFATVVMVTKGQLKGRMFDYDDDNDTGEKAVLYCPNISEGVLRYSPEISKKWIRRPTLADLISRRQILQRQWIDAEFVRHNRNDGDWMLQDSIDTLLELILVERELFDRIHRAEMSGQFTSPSPVFVSYASHDSWFVGQLNAELIEHGIRPWTFEWDIDPGDNFTAKISDAIDASAVIMVVLSRSSLQSLWVRQEWTTALTLSFSKNKSVIPILLEDCEIPALLATVSYADFRQGFNQKAFDGLYRSLRKRLNVDE
jgi:hypothetical protein